MARYTPIRWTRYSPDHHRKNTVAHRERCSLHGSDCTEPPVASMIGRDRSGNDVRLALCARGQDEYALADIPTGW
ncbi:hypothetical protein [Embleya sp. NPDC059259]|uniref:hypothetical protein n=1 Tax=unclassified Embleya TaxID=2699296 RepID=UPI0036C91AB6